MTTNKHNVTWYNKRIAALEVTRRQVQTEIEGMAGHAGDFTCEQWNNACDREAAIMDAIRSLGSQKQTRNWTGADWSAWELVSCNID